jgi:hypothetical protein
MIVFVPDRLVHDYKTMKNIIFASLFLCCLSTVAAASEVYPAFTIVSKPRAVSAAERMSVASRREAVVRFDPQVVSSLATAVGLRIPVFDKASYLAEKRDLEVRSPDDFTWRGKLVEEEFDGDVILTFRHGFVAGLIYTPRGVYEITPAGDKHLLIELDQSVFPECAGDIHGGPATGLEVPQASIDSGDRIDVMVVYTTASKNILGGDPQAQVLSQQAIDATNTAYMNSRIRQRVRMVHSQEYQYTETSSASTDLSNLRANAAIGTLRNTHKADLVAMIGEMQGVCGIGYLMGSTAGNPNNGFSATARTCAVGNLTLAHEMGHNMGSHHNPENGGTPTYPYGFGHYVNGLYRTVMSYVDPCSSGCPRHPYFSNPNIVFMGVPTGLGDQRDNARSINNTADVISNYRYSGANLMLTNFLGPDVLSSYYRSMLYWTSENVTGDVRIDISRDESATWQTLVPSTPNDGSHGIFNIGQQTPFGRLRVVSIANPSVTDSSNANIALK